MYLYSLVRDFTKLSVRLYIIFWYGGLKLFNAKDMEARDEGVIGGII